MTVLPAISLHQPCATLCATPTPCDICAGPAGPPVARPYCDGCTMVKRWETRSRPCPPKYLGQRIAIASTVRRPQPGDWIGEYHIAQGGTWVHGPGLDVRLSLGAVVCTAVIARSLPIVQFEAISRYETPLDRGYGKCIEVGDRLVEPDRLTEWYHHDAGFHDISDQRPYGDWTPGRWAWELVDVEPVDMPSGSHKGRQGWHTAEVPT